MEGSPRRTLCRAQDDRPADAGHERKSGHHGSDHQFVHAFAAHPQCAADHLPGLRPRIALSIPGSLSGACQTFSRSLRVKSRRSNRGQGKWRSDMNPNDFPAPKDGFVITHFLVVSDQDRSRDFYQRIFDGKVLIERDPVIIKVANSWLILNVGGGPTDDKPTVTLTTPPDPNRTSALLNIRVADIARVYREWSAKGAQFLTEPKDHGREIRAYIRDPDGHLIEVGQAIPTQG